MKLLQFLIFFISVPAFTQNYFPVNRDGKWGLMNEDGGEVLAPMYDFIRFDFLGDKFVFDSRGIWGIMEKDGTILQEPLYQHVSFFSKDMSARKLNNKWGLYGENVLLTEHEYDSIRFIGDSLYTLFEKSEAFLYHTRLRKKSIKKYTDWELQPGLIQAFNQNKSSDLIMRNTLDIYVSEINSIKWNEFDHIGIISYADSMQLIHGGKALLISKKYQLITREFGKWFLVRNDTMTYLFDKTSSDTYLIPDIDELVDVGGNVCIFVKKKKYGAFNYKTGKEVLPATYAGLAIKSGYIYTSDGSAYGLSTLTGREIFAPEFENIEDYGKVFVVWKDGKSGIASKSGNIIEPIAYADIEIYDKNVKCYKGKSLTTLNIDAAGNLKDRTVYETYMRVNFTKAIRPVQKATYLNFQGSNNNRVDDQEGTNNLSGVDDPEGVNKHLYGWFQREMERTINDSIFTIYGSWGYKDENDSLRIKHQYQEIVVYNERLTRGYRERRIDRFGNDASLKTALQRKLFYKIGDFLAIADGKFQLVNHQEYYHLSQNFFMYVAIEDWQKYALARAFTNKPVLINSMGTIVFDNITYYSNFYHNDLLRVCLDGEYEFYHKGQTIGALFDISTILRNFGFRYPTFVDKNNKTIDRSKNRYAQYKPLCHIKGGKWHFVDKNGNLRNEEPFQYAHEFIDGRAIVQRNGKWGVVDTAMNVIVPIEFDVVSRMFVDGQIFFTVYRKNHQFYYYNRSQSSYRPTDLDPSKLHTYHQGKWIYGQEESGILIDTNLNELGKAPYSAVYSGYGNYKIVGIGEGYQLLDENGKLLEKSFERHDFWPIAHGRFIVKNGDRNFAIVDGKGDYLVPKYIGYQLISNTPDYIFYLDYNLNFNYWGKQPISVRKKVKILSGNPEKGLLLCQKGKRKFLYNFTTQEVIKKDVAAIKSLEKGGMIYVDESNNDRLGLISYDGDTICKSKYQEIDYSGKDWGIAKIQSEQYMIIDLKGDLIYQDTFSTIAQSSARKDRYNVITSTGRGLLNDSAVIIFPFKYSTISHYENDIYKLKEHENDTTFYSRENGEIVYKVRYETALGFPPDGYITIGEHDPRVKGLRYFYNGYQNLYLPFTDIYPLSSNTFVLEESSQTGIYDYFGDTIVPPLYHEVHPVRGKFQVRFFNSFGYINQDKSRLYDPRIINER